MPADDNLRPINFGRDHPNHMVITSRNSSWIRALALQSIMLRRVRASIVLFILTCAGVLSVNLAGADESVPMNVSITEANNGSTIDVAIGATVNVFLKVPESEIYKASCLWSNITVSGAAVLQEEKKAVLLPTGVTATSFKALQRGEAKLRSSRLDCSKGLTTEWRVNVRVT